MSFVLLGHALAGFALGLRFRVHAVLAASLAVAVWALTLYLWRGGDALLWGLGCLVALHVSYLGGLMASGWIASRAPPLKLGGHREDRARE